MKELIEKRIKDMGYTIVGKWEQSLKCGWRIEVSFRVEGRDHTYYSYLYLDDIVSEMFAEEMRALK